MVCVKIWEFLIYVFSMFHSQLCNMELDFPQHLLEMSILAVLPPPHPSIHILDIKWYILEG